MNKKQSPRYFQLKGKNAEEFVHNMATNTFLTDWCFLNPELTKGKELCDLLVVFDDIAIIWQIKDLKLGKDGKYKKSEVEKNLRQLEGARRQLFGLKTPIYLKNGRRKEELFKADEIRYTFLISVLLGKGEEAFTFIEEVKNSKVHVFNREFCQIMLRELDTISDFVEYMRKKELFLQEDQSIIIVGGEQELLAYYLLNNRNFNSLTQKKEIIINEGSWARLQNDKRYVAKKKADEISYGWDSIINRAHEGSDEYELVARELARPNRFQRRYLSKVFFEAHKISHLEEKMDLYRRILPTDGVTYCFLFYDESDPREKRKAMLWAICTIARVEFTNNKKVIGIATEMKFKSICSYDFVLLNIPELNKEFIEKTKEMQKQTGIFKNPVFKHDREDEYPDVV
jgi:hypothetical protein